MAPPTRPSTRLRPTPGRWRPALTRSATRCAPTVQLGTPAGVEYSVDAALATSLGPRDEAWLEAAVGDSRLAVDVTPWWADAIDARNLLNRALCLMWTDVRWRAPANDAERRV